VKTPKWICNICKQTLTRKWNAERHCILKHGGISDSIVPFSDHMQLTTKTKIHPYLFNQGLYSSTINNNQTSYRNPFFQFKPSAVPNNTNSHHGYTPQEGNTVNNSTKREKLLSDILDKIAPKYEEYRNILSYLPDTKKESIVGEFVFMAITSDNPIKFVNKCIRDAQKVKFHNMMLVDASRFLGLNIQTTKEYLKNLLKEDIAE